MSLDNEPWFTMPALIYLNPIKLNYYPFMNSLDKYNESCNTIDDLYTKICVPFKRKDVNVKVFNMIRIIEVKTLIEQISCDCKCKFDTITWNPNEKWNNDKCQYESKKCRASKIDFS